MRKICTLLTLIYTVFIVEVRTVDKDFSGLTRNKRQEADDRWSWGYVEITDPPDNQPYISSTSLPDTNYPDIKACDPYNPVVPNFFTPGRRISEAKCDEYIWHMRVREEKQNKNDECEDYKNAHAQWDSKNPPPVAAIGGHITQPGEYPHMDFSLLHMATLNPIYPPAVGGHSTYTGEYPHMGAVGWKPASGGTWLFKCGSSLISARFLLTAGHCSRTAGNDFSVADPVPKIVRLGDKNIADVYSNHHFPEDANIFKILVHPQYSPPKKYNDIAIIQLAADVQFTKFIQPACLWTKFDTSSLGTEATLTGWGVVETTNLTTSPELQAAEVDIIESSVCDKLMRSFCNRLWCGMQAGQICAGKLAGGVDACQGDSGGPLQVKIPLNISTQGSLNYVIGVTSFGKGCALANKPGIYTRVSYYIDWIESVVWP